MEGTGLLNLVYIIRELQRVFSRVKEHMQSGWFKTRLILYNCNDFNPHTFCANGIAWGWLHHFNPIRSNSGKLITLLNWIIGISVNKWRIHKGVTLFPLPSIPWFSGFLPTELLLDLILLQLSMKKVWKGQYFTVHLKACEYMLGMKLYSSMISEMIFFLLWSIIIRLLFSQYSKIALVRHTSIPELALQKWPDC